MGEGQPEQASTKVETQTQDVQPGLESDLKGQVRRHTALVLPDGAC